MAKVKARKWVGPFSIEELLANSVIGKLPLPPESGSAYLVSENSWSGSPNSACNPLYVGGTTGISNRFRTRVGDLIADMYGFYGGGTGHHSGGQSLNGWCKKNSKSPSSLFIAWVAQCSCHRCLEVELVGDLCPHLNKKMPARCKDHLR